jgi:hypothetical protein
MIKNSGFDSSSMYVLCSLSTPHPPAHPSLSAGQLVCVRERCPELNYLLKTFDKTIKNGFSKNFNCSKRFTGQFCRHNCLKNRFSFFKDVIKPILKFKSFDVNY